MKSYCPYRNNIFSTYKSSLKKRPFPKKDPKNKISLKKNQLKTIYRVNKVKYVY